MLAERGDHMTQSIDLSTFRDVDGAPDPPALIRLLDGGKHQPGIAALSIDTASAVLDHPDAWTTRRITETWADGFAGGRVGRSLHRLFREAGLVDATVDVRAAPFPAAFVGALLRPTTARMVHDGELDPDAADRWWTVFEKRAAS